MRVFGPKEKSNVRNKYLQLSSKATPENLLFVVKSIREQSLKQNK